MKWTAIGACGESHQLSEVRVVHTAGLKVIPMYTLRKGQSSPCVPPCESFGEPNWELNMIYG